MEKHVAWAAASNSSGDVRELSPPVRAFQVTGTSASWPLLLPVMRPLPSLNPPSQWARAS